MKDKLRMQSGGKKIFLAAAVILIAALIFVVVFQYRRHLRTQEQIRQGVSYLTELENQDVEVISENIKSTRSILGMEQADTDESAVWSAFGNSVILGDSRAVGFNFYEFLPEERVLAKSGGRITDVPEYMEQLKNLNPDMIFLCYGLNDIVSGLWPEPEDYAAEYEGILRTVQEALPDGVICVNSILPPNEVGLESNPGFERYGEYNEALSGMCEQNGWKYIDNTEVARQHSDLYSEDGIHMGKEFYKYWAANMLTGVEEE